MKLISMTDYVFLCRENRENKTSDNIRMFWACERYANFLKTPLELGMFVPVDEKGNASEVEEPDQSKVPNMHPNEQHDYWQEWNADYNKAKENIIFENCSMFDEHFIRYGNGKLFHINHLKTTTIEFFCDKDLTLTQNAIKKYRI